MQIRKAHERGITHTDWLKSYHSFSFAEYYDSKHMGFSVLRVINQDIIAPGAGFGMHAHHDMEILTYVLRGAIAHRDSLGNETLIHAGELQRMSAGSGIRHSEYNPSTTQEMELLQIWLRPNILNIPPSYQQIRFPELKNQWQLLASSDGVEDSILLHQDVKLYRAFVMAKEQLFYAAKERAVWFQVVSGILICNGEQLTAGDACSLQKGDLQLTALQDAQVLLFDLP